ncbi:hypothetical protein D9M70_476670 [compost metagenome]
MALAIVARDQFGKHLVKHADQHERQDGDPGVGQLAMLEGLGLVGMAFAIALVARRGLAPAPVEVGKAHYQDKYRSDHAQPRRGPGIGIEESGRDDVLDLRRPWQRVHGERKRA